MQCPLRRLDNGHIVFSPRFSPCFGSRWLSLSACFIWPISGYRRPQAFPDMVSSYGVLTIRFSNDLPVWLRLCGGFLCPFPALYKPLHGLLSSPLYNPIGSYSRPVVGLVRPYRGHCTTCTTSRPRFCANRPFTHYHISTLAY